MTRRLPDDLATAENQFIGVLADEVAADEKATAAVTGDVRFEHLEHADDAVWRFVAECWADRSTDHVRRSWHGTRPRSCTLPAISRSSS